MKRAMKLFLLRGERFPLVQLHGYRMTVAVCSVSHEWLGIKPDSQTRMIVVVLAVFAAVQYLVGFSSTFGGLFVGILGGLIVAGLLATISWIIYERFLPAYRHQRFRPKISGRWFGYYLEDYLDGRKIFVEEYIYVDQIANNISGTIIERNQQEFYRFTGQVIPGTLILNWQPENRTRNIVGAIILNPKDDDQWEGIQIFGG